MIGEAEVLRLLVEECLDYDPAVRPTIATVCRRIQVNKDKYMKESPQDVITVLQEVEQLRVESAELKKENKQKDNKIQQQEVENSQLRDQNEQQRATIEQMVMKVNHNHYLI